MKKMRYIYGIIDGSEKSSFGKIGLHGEAVITVPFKDICAVVSDTPEGQQITLEDARTHESVLRTLMKNGTVIPVGFGFSVKDDSEIENLLKRGYTIFRNALKRLTGKIQVDIKVAWDRRILTEVLKDDKDVRAMTEKIREAPYDQTLKIELGRRVKAALAERERRLLPKVLDLLKELTSGFKENKIKSDDMLLNASFLLDNEKQESFLETIDELEKKYERRLTFHAVSPLPPYNFVGIQIEKPDYKRLDEARRTLGLGEEVSISEVRVAFNQMARVYHPDHNPDPDAESRFNALKKARDPLIEYCEHFPCSLKRPDVEEQLIVKETRR